MFAVTQAWNEFLYAFTFIRSAERFTLPSGSRDDHRRRPAVGRADGGLADDGRAVIVIYMLGQKFMVAA